MPQFQGFVGGSYEARSRNADAQRSVNLYAEIDESQQGKNAAALYSVPGLRVFATTPGPVRAMFAGDNRLFAVCGGSLCEIGPGGATALGSVGDDGQKAFIESNGRQLFVVSAGAAYVATGAEVKPSPVPADDRADYAGTPAGTEGTATGAAYLDGYFIAAKPDDDAFFISQLPYAGDDPASEDVEEKPGAEYWDPLMFGVKEGYPDKINAILTDHRELWLFGDQTIEVWQNTGAADFPFERSPSVFIHMGCIAWATPTRMNEGVAWLASDARHAPIAVLAQGYMPVRISTHAIEQKWATYPNTYDAEAYSYTMHGHTFWVITFLSGNATWVYDVTTKMWHERASSGAKWRARCHAYVFGKNLFGGWDNAIYEMSQTVYDDAGQPMQRIRTCPHMSNEENSVFHHRLQIDLDVADRMPEVTLDWSDDDTNTWSSPRAKLPSRSDRKGRVIWNRLGRSRDRIYRITITDPVPVALVNAYIQVTGGSS